jgi:hypothetical protein
MKCKCPVCHSKYSLEDLMKENMKNELIELAAYFGKNWTLCNEYCDCFRPEQWGSVTENKKLRLLMELKTFTEKGEFEYDGKRYKTDERTIMAAIRATVDINRYGFTNHNYLKKILVSNKAERISAEGLTAREEAAREKNVGARRTVPEGEKAKTFAEFKKERGIADLAGLVGKTI